MGATRLHQSVAPRTPTERSTPGLLRGGLDPPRQVPPPVHLCSSTWR